MDKLVHDCIHSYVEVVLNRYMGGVLGDPNTLRIGSLTSFQQVVEANSRYEYDVPNSAAAVVHCC
eukprot:SAG25_NODE_80_length_16705_cov_9.579746_21_plen_65_part_01